MFEGLPCFSDEKMQIDTGIISQYKSVVHICMKEEDSDMLPLAMAYKTVTSDIMVFGTDVYVGLQYTTVDGGSPYGVVNSKVLSAVKISIHVSRKGHQIL